MAIPCKLEKLSVLERENQAMTRRKASKLKGFPSKNDTEKGREGNLNMPFLCVAMHSFLGTIITIKQARIL